MYEDPEYRKKRIALLKRLLIVLLLVLLVFPSIVSIIVLSRQSSMQKQIDFIEKEIANMKLSQVTSNGRIPDSRLVDLGDYPDDYSPRDPFKKDALVCESPELLEDVVWTFAASGDTIHKVYLTFDDGPSDYTGDILDILNEYGVKATFFVVGKETEPDYELYKRITDEGNTLGMHSYSHVYSQVYASEASFRNDFDKLHNLITDVTGTEPLFYRFPGGSSNTVSSLDMHRFINILDEKGVTYFDWNVSSGDATGDYISVDQIVSNSISGIEDRDTTVILLHDTGTKHNTVLALPKIIETILSMEDTQILPITADTELVQHIQ